MFDIWSEKIRGGGGVLPEYLAGNIRIINHDNASGFCYIFCSSNDIWYPNSQKAYTESIIDKDRYEWTTLPIYSVEKIIYIRDIYKSWYVTGVNQDLDSIDQLIKYLKIETNGLEVICVGSSSGGYLATLLGCVLHANHVLCFSGQYELNNQWAIARNRLLQHYQNEPQRRKYFDLKPYIEAGNTEIYYVVPMKCDQDRYHYKHITDCPNVRCLCFNSKHHGVVMSKCNLPVFINYTSSELKKICNLYEGKNISVLMFSVRLVGWRKSLMGAYTEFVKQIRRRIRR